MAKYLTTNYYQIGLLMMSVVLVSCSGGDDSTPDTTPPSIVSTSPGDNEMDVSTATSINVVFSEAMSPASFDPATSFTIEDAGGPIAGSIAVNGATAIFTPVAFLVTNTMYTATVTTGVTDLAGNALASDRQWRFTTGGKRTVNISWDANREAAVNTTGGGYKVYYSTNSGFDITDPGVTEVDVPYAGGASAPTTVAVQLDRTRYYIRVVAYSDLSAPWSSGGICGEPSCSEPSAEYTILVP